MSSVTFACPECGTEIRIAPNAVGRRARCAECLTLVEVPFFQRTRPRRRASNTRAWAIVAITASLAVVASGLVYLVVSSNMRAERRRVFENLESQALADVQRGDYANAVRRAEAAIALASEAKLIDPARIDALETARDDAIEKLRKQTNERLTDEAEAALAQARSLLAGPSPQIKGVLDACERAASAADAIESNGGAPLGESAREIAASVIRARGVVFNPVAATYLEPEYTTDYAKEFWPVIRDTLDAHGFACQRDGSVLKDLWSQFAPFQFATAVVETDGGTYLDSALRITRIDARFQLAAGSAEIWKTGLTARTRTPSTRFSAFTSGYLASARKRDPELERKLREDAVVAAFEQLPAKLNSMPDWSPAMTTTRY